MSPSASSLTKQAKAAPRKLPKKCWREEYIRVLEQFEFSPSFRSYISVPRDASERALFEELIQDLENAGFLSQSPIPDYDTYPYRITYSGRLELDKLKHQRKRWTVWKLGWAGLFFVLGGIFNVFLSIVEPFLASWFQSLWN